LIPLLNSLRFFLDSPVKLLLLAQELHRHLRKSRERVREREGLPSLEKGGAQKEAANNTIDTIRRKNLIHPTVHIKRVIIDSSDL
jgi:hypothetical protein